MSETKPTEFPRSVSDHKFEISANSFFKTIMGLEGMTYPVCVMLLKTLLVMEQQFESAAQVRDFQELVKQGGAFSSPHPPVEDPSKVMVKEVRVEANGWKEDKS